MNNISNVSDNKGRRSTTLKHIAFIMDGNGRWAQKRGMPREYGHKEGAKTFERVVRYCDKLGLEAATFYAFSTENWKRSPKEVAAIMSLLNEYLDNCINRLIKENSVRIVIIGDKSPFPKPLREKMERVEEISRPNHKIINLAINYGGRSEIVHAYEELMRAKKSSISENDISRVVYTHASPDVDMIVRTGGDMRLSNFLLWQAAYAELYFCDKLWPDITEEDIDAFIEEYEKRNRRFGGA